MFALVLAPKDVVEPEKIIEKRIVVIRPVVVVLELRLKAPAFAELLRADFAFFAIGGRGFPDVTIAHRDLYGAEGGFRKNTISLKEVAKIIVYLAAVVMLGAVLAPWLYWAGNAVASRGALTFLADVSLQRYFNRGVLIAALLLLWPTIRWLDVAGWRALGLEPNPHRWRHAAFGLAVGAGLVLVMGFVYAQLGVYHWQQQLRWNRLPGLALSALAVGVIEECLFRGGIFGLFRRTLPPYAALFCVTALFAVVHFLKPDEDVQIANICWSSGFALVPHAFHQFAEPMNVLASFSTIFVLGWVLGYAALRTRSLWLGIGLHAGVVFAKMSFAKFTKRDAMHMPWIGPELQIGLVPMALLAFGGVLIWFYLRHEDSPTHR